MYLRYRVQCITVPSSFTPRPLVSLPWQQSRYLLIRARILNDLGSIDPSKENNCPNIYKKLTKNKYGQEVENNFFFYFLERKHANMLSADMRYMPSLRLYKRKLVDVTKIVFNRMYGIVCYKSQENVVLSPATLFQDFWASHY